MPRATFTRKAGFSAFSKSTAEMPVAPSVAELLSQVRNFTDGVEQGDDITLPCSPIPSFGHSRRRTGRRDHFG